MIDTRPGPLTERQAEAYRQIVVYREANGESPTVEKLSRLLGMAYSTSAQQVVLALARKGWIRRVPGAARSNVPLYPLDAVTLVESPVRCPRLRQVGPVRRLTTRQADLLHRVLPWVSEHGCLPSARVLVCEFRAGRLHASRTFLAALVRKGWAKQLGDDGPLVLVDQVPDEDAA